MRVTPKLKPEQGCSSHLLRSRRCAVQFCTTLREREAMPPGSAAERRKSLAIRVTRQDGESAGGRMTATHCSRFRGPEWRPRRPRQAGHSTVVLGSQNKKPMSWTKAGQSAGWQSLCPQHRQQFSTRKHTVNKKTFLAHGKGNYLLSLCTHFF